MLKDIIRGKWKEEVGYQLVFDDGRGNGFAFNCDADGNANLSKMSDGAFENLKFCMEHPEKFKRFGKVIEWKQGWREPDRGTCHCGQAVELVNEYMGSCQCPKCGQWYNLFGQELLPPEEWGTDEDY